jgi:hypothetical protein
MNIYLHWLWEKQLFYYNYTGEYQRKWKKENNLAHIYFWPQVKESNVTWAEKGLFTCVIIVIVAVRVWGWDLYELVVNEESSIFLRFSTWYHVNNESWENKI